MAETKQTTPVTDLASLGPKLLAHSKSAEFTNRRGLVVELYPFIFGAAERMTAKAISDFLKKEQGVQISAVTIGKALNDPKKYWNRFFDIIEDAARTFQRGTGETLQELLFRDRNVKNAKHPGYKVLSKMVFTPDEQQADLFLREKWFVIDLDVRRKALPYLAERVLGKAGK